MNLVANLDYVPSQSDHVLKTYTDLYITPTWTGSYVSTYSDIPAIGTGSSYRYPKGMFVGGSNIISNMQFGHTCINATQVWPPIISVKLDSIAYDNANGRIIISCNSPYALTEVAYARQAAFTVKYAYTGGTKPNCTYQMYDSYITASFPSSNSSHTVWMYGNNIFIKNEPNFKYKILPVEDYECLNKADLYPGYFTHIEFLSPGDTKAKTTPTISGYLFDHNTSTHISRRQYSFDDDININANIGTGTTYYGKTFQWYCQNRFMRFRGHNLWLDPTYDEDTSLLFDRYYLNDPTNETQPQIKRERYDANNDTYINTYHGPFIASIAFQKVSTSTATALNPPLIVPTNNAFGTSSHMHYADGSVAENNSFYLGVSETSASKITGIKFKKTTANGNELCSAWRGAKNRNTLMFPLLRGVLGNPNAYASIIMEKNPQFGKAPGAMIIGSLANSDSTGFPRYIGAYTGTINFIGNVRGSVSSDSFTHMLYPQYSNINLNVTWYDAESMALGTYVYFYPYITMMTAYTISQTNAITCSYVYATYTTPAPICAKVVQYAYNNGSPGSGVGTGTNPGHDDD